MKIRELTLEEFLNFSKSFQPSSIYQTINYGLAMDKNGYQMILAGLFDDDILKGASLILVYKINGFKYALAPRGFLIDYNDEELVKTFIKNIKKFLGRKDIAAIKINPMIIKKTYDSKGRTIYNNETFDKTFNLLTKLGCFHLGYNNYFEALKPRFEAFINLDLNYIKLFGNMNKGTKNKIRKGIRDGIKVYRGSINDLDYLYAETKSKYPRNLKYFSDLYEAFDKDGMVDFYYCKLDTTDYLKYNQDIYSRLISESNDLSNKIMDNNRSNKLISRKLLVDKKAAKYRNRLAEATEYLKKYPNGIVVSSALVAKWKEEVYIIIDGYDDNFKKFGSKQLLIWKLIGRYAQLGFKRLNLGGMTNINEPNNKFAGLNNFKMNFHSNVIEYVGDFELVTNSPLYFMYKNSFGITGILGGKK